MELLTLALESKQKKSTAKSKQVKSKTKSLKRNYDSYEYASPYSGDYHDTSGYHGTGSGYHDDGYHGSSGYHDNSYHTSSGYHDEGRISVFVEISIS